MKIRPARGIGTTIDEAMAEVREVSGRGELIAYLQREYPYLHATDENVTVTMYCRDERIGWDTYLVCVDGKAALFSDGPCSAVGKTSDHGK